MPLADPIDPTKRIMINGQSYAIQSIAMVVAVAANQVVVAGSTGKRVRLYGWIMQGNGAGLSGVQFLDGSGGTSLTLINVIPNTNGGNDKLPIQDYGYFETSTGNGLYVTGTTQATLATFFYIQYTPSP